MRRGSQTAPYRRRHPQIMADTLVPVFDLGNVLLFVHEDRFFDKLVSSCRAGVPVEELFYREFARHRVATGGDFNLIHPTLVREASLRMGLEQFRLAWNDAFTPNPPMLELVAELPRPRYLLSNTNEPHVAWFHEQYPEILALFDQCVFSNEVGISKPDLAIYRIVESLSGRSPDCHVFFDDVMANVEGALAAGWQAFQFHGVQDCRERLAQLRQPGARGE